MSRSGYSDDCENMGLWRGAVKKSIEGKRGQSFLKEMLLALDSLPEKRLIANDFKSANGEVCALGSIGTKRGIDMSKFDNEDTYVIGKAFGISMAMAAEIMYQNDEGTWNPEMPEERFIRIREWVAKNLNRNPGEGSDLEKK